MQSLTRPRIIHVVVAGAIGGAEQVIVNLACSPELTGADHSLALMTPNPKLRALFADAGLRIHDRGPVHENPLAYLWRSYGPSDIAWLGRVIEAEKADVLHAHVFGSLVLSARAGLRYGRPVLRTEHGVRHYEDPTCALYRHWAVRHTNRIVAVSGFIGRRVGEIAPHAKGKIQVIWNGIDLKRFAPVPPPQDGPFTVAAVCRLVPFKRLTLAVEALARAPGIRLLIAGDGSERGKLEQMVGALGLKSRVRFFGYLRDPRPVIAACDALINCTRQEPLSTSIIEAAAMQRPTVAFKAGGTPEIVEDGRTGWLAPEDSVAALAAALIEAGSSRARAAEFGLNARAAAESKFAIEAMCRNYAPVYRELAGARLRRTQP